MVAARQLRGPDDALGLAGAGPDEEDEPRAHGDAVDDAAGASEVAGSHFGGYDVDAVADAEDVGAVGGVPVGGGVAEVGLRGDEEGDGDVFLVGGVGDE